MTILEPKLGAFRNTGFQETVHHRGMALQVTLELPLL